MKTLVVFSRRLRLPRPWKRTTMMAALQSWTCGLLLLLAVPPAGASQMYSPEICYILDGFLGLYSLIVTGMFIKERFFKSGGRSQDEGGAYAEPTGRRDGGYDQLSRDAERGRNRRTNDDDVYTDLNRRTDGEHYRELPAKRERHRKNEQIYQGLSSATRDTYDTLHMQQLPAR